MRKLTQKLVLSVVTMALVVIALGTSTFAWFTLTNSATVGQFTADVTAGEGIEISLGTWDSVNDVATLEEESIWYTSIPQLVIQNRLTDMYGSNLSLTDVTSADGKVMYPFGSVIATDNLAGDYIEFKLWFRSAQANTITVDKVSITGGSETWIVDLPYVAANNNAFAGATTMVPGTPISVAAWTAARVSIFDETTLGGVWQRAAVTGTDFTNTVFNSDVQPAVSYASAEQFGAASYYALKTETVLSAPGTAPVAAAGLADTGVIASPVSVVVLSQASANDPYLGSVTVRVWIEGWDADLFDSIFATSLNISLGFTVL